MTDKPTFKDLVLRAIAVVGLVAVLLVGAWGIIQIAFYIPTLFNTTDTTQIVQTSTSSGSPSALPGPESLALVAPNIISSKQPFLLSWDHQNETGAYAYQLSYSCGSGVSAVSLEALVPTGAFKAVPCNTPFNFIQATSSMPIQLAVSSLKQGETTITVAAQRLSDGAITASASSTITVLPATTGQTATVSGTTPATPPTTTATKPAVTTSVKPATTPRATLYGSPDLAVQILSLTPSNITTGQTHYTAQFVVTNVGTNVSPANWEFSVLIPLTPSYTYWSPVQQKLYPGDKIVYTLGFDVPFNQYNPNCSGYTNTYPYTTNYNNCPVTYPNYSGGSPIAFTVTVDPQNIVNESNESNNTASIQTPTY